MHAVNGCRLRNLTGGVYYVKVVKVVKVSWSATVIPWLDRCGAALSRTAVGRSVDLLGFAERGRRPWEADLKRPDPTADDSRPVGPSLGDEAGFATTAITAPFALNNTLPSVRPSVRLSVARINLGFRQRRRHEAVRNSPIYRRPPLSLSLSLSLSCPRRARC